MRESGDYLQQLERSWKRILRPTAKCQHPLLASSSPVCALPPLQAFTTQLSKEQRWPRAMFAFMVGNVPGLSWLDRTTTSLPPLEERQD